MSRETTLMVDLINSCLEKASSDFFNIEEIINYENYRLQEDSEDSSKDEES